MSGFEVAGIVLGAIPFLIKALQMAIGSLEDWSSSDRILHRLIRDLSTEQIIIESVCTKMLEKLVSPAQIPVLINNRPDMMAAWKDEHLRQRIEVLLDRAFDNFKGTWEDIRSSINELRNKLGISDDQSTRPKSHPVIEELKRVRLVWNKTAYYEIIDTIRRGVIDLRALLDFAIADEPGRRIRSQGRLMDLVNETSSSVYHALKSNFPCGAGCTHQIHLDLESCSAGNVDNVNKKPTQTLSFRLAVNYRAVNTVTETQDSSHSQLLWKELLMQTLKSEILTETVPIRCQPGNNNQANQQTETQNTSTQQRPVQTGSYGGQTTVIELRSSSQTPARPAINLCQEIRASPKSKDVPCYGIIVDNTTKSAEFEVIPKTTLDGEECSSISLHQILEAGDNGLPYADKMHLAAQVSSSFLQLHSTPWLPEKLNSRHILFLKRGRVINFGQAFVMRSFPETSFGCTDSVSNDHGAALRCLGIVLLELYCEETLESLRRRHRTEPRSNLSAEIDGMLKLSGDAVIDRLIRSRIDDLSYGRVVQVCMGGSGHHGTVNLNNKASRQKVYERVVQPLESVISYLTLGTLTHNA